MTTLKNKETKGPTEKPVKIYYLPKNQGKEKQNKTEPKKKEQIPNRNGSSIKTNINFIPQKTIIKIITISN